MKTKLFKIRGKTPGANTLNKPLIITLGIIIALLLIWGLLKGLSPEKKVTSHQEEETLSTARQTSKILQALPKNYQDIKSIQQYLTPTSTTKIDITPLENQINQLENSQTQLESKLSQLQMKTQIKPKSMPTAPETNPNTLNARKSALFFSDTAPKETEFSENQGSSSSNIASNDTPYEQQNMQNQKISFLNSNKASDIYDTHSLVKPLSPYEVQAGTVIPATLLTAVNTSLPGTAIAQVKHDVYDSVSGKYLLIPKGSKMIGEYDSKIAYGQERILLVFDRIVMPDGDSIELSKFSAADTQGDSGLTADVNNHWARILGAATISTVLSIGAGVASDSMGNQNNFYRSAEQNAALGGANNISSVGQNLTNKAIDVQPTLSIPAGTQFDVLVNRDMILEKINPS